MNIKRYRPEHAGHRAGREKSERSDERHNKKVIPVNQFPLVPENCPKWNFCSAPICPLDSNCPDSCYLKGESVCFYLREAVKSGAEGRFWGCGTERTERVEYSRRLWLIIQVRLPKITDRYGTLRRELARSAKAGPRLGVPPGQRKRKAAA